MIINNKKIYLIIFFILIFLLFVFRFHGTSYKFDPNVCELPMKWKHSAATFEKIQSAIEDKHCGIEINIVLNPEGYFISEYDDPWDCLLYTSPSPRDAHESRMPSSA